MTGFRHRSRRSRLGVLAGAALAVLIVLSTAVPAAAAPPVPATLDIVTVPPVPGARFSFDGSTVVTDAQGRASLAVHKSRLPHRLDLLTPTVSWNGWSADFVRWGDGPGVERGAPDPGLDGLVVGRSRQIQVGFRVGRTVGVSVVDQNRRPADAARVSAIELRADSGEPVRLPGVRPVFLASARPVMEGGELVAKEVTYSVAGTAVDGANVVDAGRQRIAPGRSDQLSVAILLRSLRLRVVDRFFGTPVAAEVAVTYPNRQVERLRTASDGVLTLPERARGAYNIRIVSGGISVPRTVALSGDQDIEAPVVTPVDIAVVVGVLVLLLIGLVLLRRRTRPLPEPTPLGAEAPGEPDAVDAGREPAGSGSARGSGP